MVAYLAVFCAYLGACLVASLLHRQVFPRTITARWTAKQPELFVLWPVIAAVDVIAAVGRMIGLASHVPSKSKGGSQSRRKRRKKRVAHGYFTYGQTDPAARRSSRSWNRPAAKRQKRRKRIRA
ncbi:hypothetical protein KUW15_13685 [Qipengyuania aquimaris]|uniref:hypothetical protein n=1 Tax=Qipengyuania aquimaris TaxID=255984 RepID=UPI001C9864A0|nr:hypothetical protein [Qipengyuania aquimaris]MBY6129768.1 hypothetical protein [Qipengyuania aquimaris]